MKLYDFHCNACGHKFEELVREISDARCSACGSSDVSRQLSAFAVGGTRSSAPEGGGCSGPACGSGMCGLD